MGVSCDVVEGGLLGSLGCEVVAGGSDGSGSCARRLWPSLA